MHTTAVIGIGSVHPGHGVVSGAAACRPISSYKSPVVPAAGAAAAGLAGAALAAGLGAAGLGAPGLGAALPAGAADEPPGIFSGCWQAGHLTVLPANSSLAAKA